MNASRRRRGPLMGLWLLLAASPGWAAMALGAKFGDVILEHVQPGQTYDLRDVAHVPFAVENHGDDAQDIVVEFEKPAGAALMKDYESVPDPGWFRAIPGKMRIAAHSVGFFDLVMTVPDDPGLKGKNFQVTVKARTTGDALFSLAVTGRVRFSIGPGPDSVQDEKKKKAMQQLDFDVTPSEIYLHDVPIGRKFEAKADAKKSIRVANYSSDALSVLMTVERWDRNAALPDGYEPIPDPGWIKMAKSTVTVATDAIGQADFAVTVPDDAKWKGRKYAAMIRTGLTTGFWLDAPVKVFVETKP